MCRRHAGQSWRWASAAARSWPATRPSAISGSQLPEPCAPGGVRRRHGRSSCSSSAAASRSIAARIRVFAVPSGIPSLSATSRAVMPAERGEHQRPALLDGQRPDGRAQLVGGLRRDGRVFRGLARQHVLQLQRVDRDRPPGAGRVDSEVVGDRGQPGAHGAASRVEEGRVPPRPLERLLRHVFGEGRVAEHGQRNAEDPPLETAHERHRQLGVPRREAREQQVVGHPIDLPPTHPTPRTTQTRGRAYDHAMTTTEPTSSSIASGTCTASNPRSPNAAWAKLTTKTGDRDPGRPPRHPAAPREQEGGERREPGADVHHERAAEVQRLGHAAAGEDLARRHPLQHDDDHGRRRGDAQGPQRAGAVGVGGGVGGRAGHRASSMVGHRWYDESPVGDFRPAIP